MTGAPASSRVPSGAPVMLGRYELLRELATGGMATVHVARACGVAGFGRLVAVKRLHPHLSRQKHFMDMFLDEARVAARIHDGHVVSTLDMGGDRERGYYLVMEYVPGEQMAALMRAAAAAGKRITIPVILRIVVDALAGLAAAHRATDDHGQPLHVVHRDVSPHNLIVGADGVTRVTDFGVARAAGRIASTESGQIKGKLSYMAPEQAAAKPVDGSADLFSMGVVLWEALTRQRLFYDKDARVTLQKLLQEPTPPPSLHGEELTPLNDVVMRALHRNPRKRYRSAQAFIAAIEKAAPSVGGIAPPRAVAHLVKLLASGKLDAEREGIQSALRAADARAAQAADEGGHSRVRRSSEPPLRSEFATERPTAPTVVERPFGAAAQVAAAADSNESSAQEESGPRQLERAPAWRRTALLVAACLLVLAGLGLAAVGAWDPELMKVVARRAPVAPTAPTAHPVRPDDEAVDEQVLVGPDDLVVEPAAKEVRRPSPSQVSPPNVRAEASAEVGREPTPGSAIAPAVEGADDHVVKRKAARKRKAWRRKRAQRARVAAPPDNPYRAAER